MLILRDREVREALHRTVLKEHWKQKDTLVVDELGLRHGTCRIDIAVVNGYLHGFEIKSDADTLDRLENQVKVYSSVLDRATLVVGERHAERAISDIPLWWGVKIAVCGPRGGVAFENHRTVTNNPEINPFAVAELLWRPEVSKALIGLGAPKAALRQPRSAQYRLLVEMTGLDELRSIIRENLKARTVWRGHRPPL